MYRYQRGFTLIELIAVIVILGVMAFTVTARFPNGNIASVQTSRDHLLAALFFAQQKAMAQNNIKLNINAASVNVTHSGKAFVIHQDAYPLAFASGVKAMPSASFSYNKLGQITNLTNSQTITLQKGGTSATITIEPSGYAY